MAVCDRPPIGRYPAWRRSSISQQKQRASFVLPAGNSKYTQQHVVAVGDADKVFARSDIVAATDAGKSATLAAGRITGGTGKFRNVRGIIRVASSPDPRSGLLGSAFEIDYWFDK